MSKKVAWSRIDMDWLNAFIDMIFPPACLMCGRSGTEQLCKGCLSQILPIKGPICKICGKPEDRFFTGRLCEDCFKREPPFELARSAALYDCVLKDIIHKFKFEGKKKLATPLGEIMCRYLKAGDLPSKKIDTVIAIPLSRQHERAREYNQSLLLAEFVAAELGKPLDISSLKKIRNVRPQFSLTREERLTNVINAFSSSEIRSLNVLLIDDIYTTGATVREASMVLRSAGAKKVFVLTLARTVED